MVQLEANGVNNGFDWDPQITAVGTAGEYVVAWYGWDSNADISAFVQKFNANGTTTGNTIVQPSVGKAQAAMTTLPTTTCWQYGMPSMALEPVSD